MDGRRQEETFEKARGKRSKESIDRTELDIDICVINLW
jgi:hypothetical protein